MDRVIQVVLVAVIILGSGYLAYSILISTSELASTSVLDTSSESASDTQSENLILPHSYKECSNLYPEKADGLSCTHTVSADSREDDYRECLDIGGRDYHADGLTRAYYACTLTFLNSGYKFPKSYEECVGIHRRRSSNFSVRSPSIPLCSISVDRGALSQPSTEIALRLYRQCGLLIDEYRTYEDVSFATITWDSCFLNFVGKQITFSSNYDECNLNGGSLIDDGVCQVVYPEDEQYYDNVKLITRMNITYEPNLYNRCKEANGELYRLDYKNTLWDMCSLQFMR